MKRGTLRLWVTLGLLAAGGTAFAHGGEQHAQTTQRQTQGQQEEIQKLKEKADCEEQRADNAERQLKEAQARAQKDVLIRSNVFFSSNKPTSQDEQQLRQVAALLKQA